MSTTKMSGDIREKKIKMIVLASGYNLLQEGNYQFLQTSFATADEVKKRIGNIYYCFHPSNPQEIIVDFVDEDKKSYRISCQLDDHRTNAPLSTVQKQIILEKAKSTKGFPVNPFIEKAQINGYQVDVESIDRQSIPNNIAVIQTDYGKIERVCANLRPTLPEHHQILDAFVERWRRDIQDYDGVVFVNADGDGNIEKTYWPIYFELEHSNKVFFADWCTCCVFPRNTHRLFNHSEESISHYKQLKATVEKNGREGLFNKSTAGRSQYWDGPSLEVDLDRWFVQLERPDLEYSKSYCQPCHPSFESDAAAVVMSSKITEKDARIAPTDSPESKQMVFKSRLAEDGARAKISLESNIQDLESLLDMLFSPQNRNHSELFKSMVIECLFNMHNPAGGATHILHRINPHIDGATEKAYKETLKEIKEMVSDLIGERPRPV